MNNGDMGSLRILWNVAIAVSNIPNGRIRKEDGRNGSLGHTKRSALLVWILGTKEHKDMSMFLWTLCACKHTSALFVLCFVSFVVCNAVLFCVLCSLFYNILFIVYWSDFTLWRYCGHHRGRVLCSRLYSKRVIFNLHICSELFILFPNTLPGLSDPGKCTVNLLIRVWELLILFGFPFLFWSELGASEFNKN